MWRRWDTCRHLREFPLGTVRYPSYRVHRMRPVFPDRQALLAYEASLMEAAVLNKALKVLPAASEDALVLTETQRS